MPPRRPLVDLSLIAIFKQLPPSSQLEAARMSPRCGRLVRAANRRRRIRTLAITEPDYAFCRFQSWHPLFLYPMPSPINKWNYLQLSYGAEMLEQDTTTTTTTTAAAIAEQILTIFPDVTELVFACNKRYFPLLTALLMTPVPTSPTSCCCWATQLTNLVFIEPEACLRTTQYSTENHAFDYQLYLACVTALNGLSTLQQLALIWNHREVERELPRLRVFDQLKVFLLDSRSLNTLNSLVPFIDDHPTMAVLTERRVVVLKVEEDSPLASVCDHYFAVD